MEAVVVRYNNKKGKISFETFMSINVALIRSFGKSKCKFIKTSNLGPYIFYIVYQILPAATDVYMCLY